LKIKKRILWKYNMDPLSILGMIRQDAEDYCRERNLPYQLTETRDPRFAGRFPTVSKIVRATFADGRWQLVCAPFEMGGRL
jgi:hypothetical protein